MKKIGILIFISALVVGVVIANFTSFGSSAFKSPVSFIFGSKVHGSGNVVSESRNTGQFKAVKVGEVFNVVITRSGDTSVIVEADDNIEPLIKTEVYSGTLKIWSEKRFKTKSRVTIRVSGPEIEAVDTSGVARVKYTGIKSEALAVETSGASKVELEGTVHSLNVDMSGASKIEGEKLVAETAVVDGSGASKVRIKVLSELRANASGASSVKYSGEPGVLKKSVSGAARVKKIN